MGVRSLGNALATFGYKFGRTGLEAVGAPPPNNFVATGGIISDYGSYRAHIFTSSGTLTVTEGSTTADILIVGAGGGGGFDRGGGGGGGAFVELTNQSITPGSKTVTINAGGFGATGTGARGNNGGTTTFDTTTVKGGGGGGTNASSLRTGSPSADPFGGSGGGGAQGLTTPFAGGSGGTYGNDGGTPGAVYWGGGGGGAGQAAQDAPHPPAPVPDNNFQGGDGSPNVYAYGPTQPVTYAGGGAGNGWSGAGGNGGAGGGADAGPGLATPSNRMGVPGTGGGGAGAQADEYSGVVEASGGNGGSGVVVVRYQLAQKRSQKATGGAISHHNGKTIHTFVNTGVFTVPGSFNETVEYVMVGGGGGGGASVLSALPIVPFPPNAFSMELSISAKPSKVSFTVFKAPPVTSPVFGSNFPRLSKAPSSDSGPVIESNKLVAKFFISVKVSVTALITSLFSSLNSSTFSFIAGRAFINTPVSKIDPKFIALSKRPMLGDAISVTEESGDVFGDIFSTFDSFSFILLFLIS